MCMWSVMLMWLLLLGQLPGGAPSGLALGASRPSTQQPALTRVLSRILTPLLPHHAPTDVRFGDVMSMESLSSVAFKDPVDVVVSCLASRTGALKGGLLQVVAAIGLTATMLCSSAWLRLPSKPLACGSCPLASGSCPSPTRCSVASPAPAHQAGGIKDSWDIDYQATLNAMEAGRKQGASHFVLLSAICVQVGRGGGGRVGAGFGAVGLFGRIAMPLQLPFT